MFPLTTSTSRIDVGKKVMIEGNGSVLIGEARLYGVGVGLIYRVALLLGHGLGLLVWGLAVLLRVVVLWVVILLVDWRFKPNWHMEL